MSRNPEYAALVERLRADLTKAEEEVRQATTPESKQQAIEHYEKVLAQYTDLVLRRKPTSSAGST